MTVDRPQAAVSAWTLQRPADAGLFRGRTVGIEATTPEANEATRSIMHRDTREVLEKHPLAEAHSADLDSGHRQSLL